MTAKDAGRRYSETVDGILFSCICFYLILSAEKYPTSTLGDTSSLCLYEEYAALRSRDTSFRCSRRSGSHAVQWDYMAG